MNNPNPHTLAGWLSFRDLYQHKLTELDLPSLAVLYGLSSRAPYADPALCYQIEEVVERSPDPCIPALCWPITPLLIMKIYPAVGAGVIFLLKGIRMNMAQYLKVNQGISPVIHLPLKTDQTLADCRHSCLPLRSWPHAIDPLDQIPQSDRRILSNRGRYCRIGSRIRL
jgi:hypothetical protein